MRRVRTIARAWPLAAALLAGCADHLERTPAAPTACGAASAGAPWLGCANRANLAAMVADPADLERGRELTPASGARAANVIRAYEAPAPAPEVTRTETTK